MMKQQTKGQILRDYLLILVGGILYAISTVLFIFPHGLLLGGTSGASVILDAYLPYSPGTILLVINTALLIVAFLILGKQMAVRTLVGSTITTVMITLLEQMLKLESPVVVNPFISVLIGAAIVAVASGVMYYVDSSSGGTDILALIIRKYSSINIGKAQLIADFLVVLIGGILSGLTIAISSVLGLLVKTFGIDFVIGMIKRGRKNA